MDTSDTLLKFSQSEVPKITIPIDSVSFSRPSHNVVTNLLSRYLTSNVAKNQAEARMGIDAEAEQKHYFL